MGIRAIRKHMGGGWRAWTVLRQADQPKGSGFITCDTAESYAKSIGISKRKWRRWVFDAIDNGFVQVIERHRDFGIQPVFKIAGKKRVASLLECKGNWDKAVDIDANLLFRHDCAAWVWGGYLTTLRDIPTTRNFMRKQTDVPATTQRRYEHELNLIVTQNYAFTNRPADQLTGFKENCVGHAFVWHDNATGEEIIAYRMGDRRLVQEPGIKRHEPVIRERTKSHKSNSNTICGKSDAARAIRVRRFHLSHKSLVSACNRLRKLDIANVVYDRPKGFFELDHSYKFKGTRIWRVEVI